MPRFELSFSQLQFDETGTEFPTKISEEIRYNPVVAAIESTMFLKSASVKTSEKVRPFFSSERPAIPLYAMNMAANWRV